MNSSSAQALASTLRDEQNTKTTFLVQDLHKDFEAAHRSFAKTIVQRLKAQDKALQIR